MKLANGKKEMRQFFLDCGIEKIILNELKNSLQPFHAIGYKSARTAATHVDRFSVGLDCPLNGEIDHPGHFTFFP
jgi:hypothetical protein